jgi:hypothetical protein
MSCLVLVKQVVAICEIFHYNTYYTNLNIHIEKDKK